MPTAEFAAEFTRMPRRQFQYEPGKRGVTVDDGQWSLCGTCASLAFQAVTLPCQGG